MKYFIGTTLFFVTIFSINAQTIEETREYLVERITANPPSSNYKNYVFMKGHVIKIDASNLVNESLSEDKFENILIVARELYDRGGNLAFTVFESIDIAGAEKISLIKRTDGGGYYEISIKRKYGYLCKEKYTDVLGKREFKDLDKMTILIGNDYESAAKIKKAIIHFAKLRGVELKDVDLF